MGLDGCRRSILSVELGVIIHNRNRCQHPTSSKMAVQSSVEAKSDVRRSCSRPSQDFSRLDSNWTWQIYLVSQFDLYLRTRCTLVEYRLQRTVRLAIVDVEEQLLSPRRSSSMSIASISTVHGGRNVIGWAHNLRTSRTYVHGVPA